MPLKRQRVCIKTKFMINWGSHKQKLRYFQAQVEVLRHTKEGAEMKKGGRAARGLSKVNLSEVKIKYAFIKYDV